MQRIANPCRSVQFRSRPRELLSVLSTLKYQLGDSQVFFNTIFKKDSNLILFHPHQNESTALLVARDFSTSNNTSFIALLYSEETDPKRNITFSFKGDNYQIDPNRIYTEDGIAKNLLLENPHLKNNTNLNTELIDLVISFSEEILQILSDKDYIIALHNNEGKNYTLRNYQIGGEQEQEALSLYDTQKNISDFFLVTDKELFKMLKKVGNFNVVLQNPDTVEDDGSLSVYCAARGINYINIEAGLNNYNIQYQMLNVLYKLIR